MKLSHRDQLATAAAEGARGLGDYRRARCPFCIERLGSDTAHVNFWVSQVTGFYGCHRCNVRGRLPGFEDDEQYVPDHSEDEPAAVVVGPPDGFQSILTRSIEMRAPSKYLQSRGVTKSIAFEAGIGACITGDMAGRIVVPVMGIDNATWLGWSSRLYREPRGDWEQAYKLAPDMNRGHVLFNLRALVSTSPTPIICCEGVFDSIRYWPNTVAFLGKPGDGHVDLLLTTERPLAICLDGDSWRESEILARKLRRLGKSNVGWVKLPAKRDPNNIDDPEKLRELCANSIKHGEAVY